MWSRRLCVLAAVLMTVGFYLGCEEETVEKKPAPKAEKVEPKPPAPVAAKVEEKAPATKTEVTVAKVTPPAPTAAAKPAPEAKQPEKPKPTEPEQKVTAPAPKTPPAVGPYKVEESVWLVDDFEQGNSFWKAESWANPAKLSVSNCELKVELAEGKQDKSAVSRAASLDLTDRGKLVLDVRNGTQKDVKVAIGFFTGGTPAYFETEMAAAKPGLNKNVTFDLKSEKFKSAATTWQHKAALGDANAVKTVCILIYGENKGEVCLDNIRFEK